MHSKWVFNHFAVPPRHHKHLLVSLWIVGLLGGMLLCAVSAERQADVLRGLIVSSPAPLLLFLVSVLPVALTIISLITPLFALSYPTVFLYAFCHGFSGIMTAACTRGGAWLLRPMLLFSASFTSVLMWWLLLRGGNRSQLKKDIRLVCILFCVIYLVDLLVVLPFLGDLSKYF